MIYSQLLVGSLLILCGFLVKLYPNLIAGYNTMSQAKKEKINIVALSTFLKQLLIGLGVFTIISFSILKLFNVEVSTIVLINTITITCGIVTGLIYANFNSQFKKK